LIELGDRDLENLISSIGQEEMAVAQKQAQIERLKQLVLKQKNEMQEMQRLIDELNGRIESMFDLPADVEELKKMIGDMRAEINRKDNQLENAYAIAGQHEAELRNYKLQMDPLNNSLQTYIQQSGELRAKLAEIEGKTQFKDGKIQELQTLLATKQDSIESMELEFADRVQNRLKDFMKTEDDYRTRMDEMEKAYQLRTHQVEASVKDSFDQIGILKTDIAERDAKIAHFSSELQDAQATLKQRQTFIFEIQKNFADVKNQLQEKEHALQNSKIHVEAELREEMFAQKSELIKVKSQLETKLLEKEMALKESLNKSEVAESKAQDISALFQDVSAKYAAVKKQLAQIQEETNTKGSVYIALKDFKDRNEGVAKNMEGLVQLFEEEPLFRCYLLVRDIGTMSVDELKKAVGVPSITIQKYVKKFIAVDLFEEDATGKITLKHKMK
jgi:chromosome segregation ATPase